jgi:hypothetical protein
LVADFPALHYGLEMVRPLGIDLDESRYHVINGGVERRRIFRATADFVRFIGVLEQLPVEKKEGLGSNLNLQYFAGTTSNLRDCRQISP